MSDIILTDEQSVQNAISTVGIETIKNKLAETVEFSKNLEIKDFTDKNQIAAVHSSKQGYVKTRNTIKRAMKFKRDEWNALSKENIKQEKDIISVIDAEESRLTEMLDKAKLLALREENKAKLADRKARLADIEKEISDEELLDMTGKDFDLNFQKWQGEYLAEKQRKLDEQENQLRIEKEKQKAVEQAREEVKQQAKQEQRDLLHFYDSHVGLWATDKPEMIPEDIKHLFFQIK